MFPPMILSMLLACIAGVHVYAAPLKVLVVYSPSILSPDASTTWISGQTETVTWDTSDMPADITNPTGKIILGYLAKEDESMHLNLDQPLAEGFDITAGHVDVVVPQVNPDSNYIIVLMGDSGNKSPEFTITSPTTGDPSSADSGTTTETETSSSTTSSPTSSSNVPPSPSSSSDVSTPSSSSSSLLPMAPDGDYMSTRDTSSSTTSSLPTPSDSSDASPSASDTDNSADSEIAPIDDNDNAASTSITGVTIYHVLGLATLLAFLL